MYEPYADADYYLNKYHGSTVPDDEILRRLTDASRHIDVLTFNRITGAGFFSLTDFQRDIIQEVCCKMADFEYENADMIESVMQSYSINGVSMSFGSSWNMAVICGIAVKRDAYQLLSQTGLCNRVLGR